MIEKRRQTDRDRDRQRQTDRDRQRQREFSKYGWSQCSSVNN